ncbi:MAG TPA: hypothetical protein VEK79_09635 [Thermoanaerobaculia bacterium]|nr:hypothetical protein [Thermoanaerobaculia bacterium]
MIGRVRARVSRLLSLILGWLAKFSPRAAFAAADALGWLWSWTARRPRFPGVETRAIRRRIWTTHARTILLGGWMALGGRERIRSLVRDNEAVVQLRPPMIVGTFHIGPIHGLSVLADRLAAPSLVLRGALGTDQQRALMFHRAIEHLQQHGFVIMALDPQEARRIEVPFLGGTLHLARGAFAMARIARVPIVPLVARWDGDAIELIVGEPLAVSTDEHKLASAAARWLEQYLRDAPGELSYRVLELM